MSQGFPTSDYPASPAARPVALRRLSYRYLQACRFLRWD